MVSTIYESAQRGGDWQGLSPRLKPPARNLWMSASCARSCSEYPSTVVGMQSNVSHAQISDAAWLDRAAEDGSMASSSQNTHWHVCTPLA